MNAQVIRIGLILSFTAIGMYVTSLSFNDVSSFCRFPAGYFDECGSSIMLQLHLMIVGLASALHLV